ncbi:RNA polymerase sigma-70 factor (family 1) [Pedobacter sp. UYP30]|uniref:RNA polymerase sigma factor n=1 Tax=Pedobacter sp. UYP30 TaxID=1756400 RepID=UPI00339AAB65
MNNEFIDSEYIQQLIAGDEAAFTIVYNLYAKKVYGVSFKFLKDKAQSEEIVQEVFIKLWLNVEKLDVEGNLWLYLFVITKRLSINALRQISKSKEFAEKLVLEVTEIHNTTEENVLLHDLERCTDNVIATLPRQQKLAYTLSRKQGLSHKEIAEQLHISPYTVNNHIVEALKTIKIQLRHFGFIYLLLFFIRF